MMVLLKEKEAVLLIGQWIFLGFTNCLDLRIQIAWQIVVRLRKATKAFQSLSALQNGAWEKMNIVRAYFIALYFPSAFLLPLFFYLLVNITYVFP